jgi:tetratricopeptide (TPR) repeat protein
MPTVAQLLGNLAADPESPEALDQVATLADDGVSEDPGTVLAALAEARGGHEARGQYLAVARILEVEVALSKDDPDRTAALLAQLAPIYKDELLDDEAARAAYGRAMELRPGDADLEEALESLDGGRDRWSDIVTGFRKHAAEASDATLKTSLLVSAASILFKHGGEDRADEVDELFQEAMAQGTGDPRATRVYATVLRRAGRLEDLGRQYLQAAGDTRSRDDRVRLTLTGARVLAREVKSPDAAASAYGEVLDILPGHVEAMAYLVDYYTEREMWDHLVALYEDQLRARRKLEDEAGTLLQAGMVHWRFRSSPEEAEPYFARLRKMDPSHPGMLDFYREVLSTADPTRWVQILTDAQRVAHDEGQRLELARELARAAQAEGSAERSIDAWKTVLRLSSDSDEAPAALKELYTRTEKWNALVELLKTEADQAEDPEAKVALLREAVPVYRDRLGLDVMVINTYTAILKLVPGDPEALEALATTYEATGRWNDLIKVLEQQAEATDDVDERVDLLIKVANLWIDRFANYNQATKPLERVVEIAPEHREALTQLQEIYRKKRAWKKLYEVLGREARLASDPDARLTMQLELARLAGDRLHKHADAIELWKEVLEAEPERSEAVDALEKLSEREKDWPTLAQVLELRVTAADDDRKKVRTLQKLGTIYGEHLEDRTRAASAWKRILDVDPKNARALRTLRETFMASGDWEGLEALYAEAGDWEGLVDVLGNAAERVDAVETKVRLSFRAAEIYEAEIGAPERAFRSYERVLAADPDNARAAEALIPLYERDEKWNRLPPLYEVMYKAREDDDGRLEILERLRQVAAERLRDYASALDYAGRAYGLAPTSEATREALEESGRRARNAEAVVALYSDRLDALGEGDEDERLWLRRRIASISGEELGQTEQAVAQLQRILEVEPKDAEAADALEVIYRNAGQSPELRGLLIHRIEHADSDAERGERLRALALLEEDVLEDPESAALRHMEILEIDPDDGDSLAALDRLTAATEDWEEHAGILQRRRALALDAEAIQELTLRIGQVHIERLDSPAEALEAFRQVVVDHPEDGAAVAGLEAVAAASEALAPDAEALLEEAYETQGAFDKLGAVLQRRLARATDPHDQQDLRLRFAELAAAQLGDAEAAFGALEEAFRAAPESVELWDRLHVAADASDRHGDLAAAFGTAVEDATNGLGDGDRAVLAGRVAHLYDVVLGEPARAEPFHRRVLLADPLDPGSFTALKELYTNAERWDDLQVLYRNRIAEVVDEDQKLDLLTQVCFLFEELIDDPELAIRAYRDVLELDPSHQASRRALERLYERTERWRDLAELLRQELEECAPDERVGLTHRLGILHERRLQEPSAAVDQYEQVLEQELNHKFAREALERLIEVPQERQRVARILEPVYEDRADWPDLADVLEVQLEDVHDPASRVALLARIAQLQETRLHDPAAAFATVARAVEADPADPTPREELARLAGIRNTERERAGVLEKVIARSDNPSLSGELLLELATLWDDQVGDVGQAEAAYARLIEVDGDNPDTVLAASRALERIHLMAGDHAALAEDLRRQVKFEDDYGVRRELLVRLADLLEETLDDRDGAIAAHRERLDLDPADIDALRALERLYERAGEWQRLIGVLQNRDGVETDPEEQRRIVRRMGEIYEEHLDDPENAIVAYNDVLARFGTDRETLDALGRLYEDAEKWQDLLEVAEMVYGLAEHVDEQAAIRFQMGELMRLRTGELERAIEAYGEVLELSPHSEDAMEALGAMMVADGRMIPVPVEATDEAEAADDGGEAADADAPEAAPEAPGAEAAGEADDAEASAADGGGPTAEAWEASEAADAGPDAGEEDEALEGEETLADGEETLAGGDAEPPEETAPVEPEMMEGPDYPIDIRIEAARRLVPRYEEHGLYEPLLVALGVLAETDETFERYQALRRAAEVADVGLEDHGRAFELLGEAVRAGLSEDDLEALLRDLFRLAGQADRWADYAALLEDVVPDVMDGDLQVESMFTVAVVTRDRLEDPSRARRLFERILELNPDRVEALDALERLVEDAEDWPALQEVLGRKTELASDGQERVALLLRRAELAETKLGEVEAAIDCFEQALADARPGEAYDGLERLYGRAERFEDLGAHYQRMLDDGVGEPVELHYRLGEVQRTRLEDAWSAAEQYRAALDLDNRHAPTIAALEALMETEDQRAAAAEILEPVFLNAMDWPKVTACLEARIAAEMDLEAKKSLLVRLGQMHEDYLEDLDGAFEAYARLFAEDPRDPSTWETLQRLARVLEKWDRLAEVLEGGLEQEMSLDEETAPLAMLAGGLHDQHTGRLDRAAALYARALEFEPTDFSAFSALEDVLARREDHDALLDLYRRQAEVADNDDDRKALHRKGARLLEGPLERPDRAIDAYRDVLMIDGADLQALEALDELLEGQERWADLADHVQHQADLYGGEPEELDLKHRLAVLRNDKLDDRLGAIDLFDEITQVDPHHGPTVTALEALVNTDTANQRRIIEILEPIYETTDQWRKRIAIYEAQVQMGQDRMEAVRLLAQIGELHETRAKDDTRLQLAFHAWSRAFALDPEDQDARANADRLATEMGTWDALVEAYERALGGTDDVMVKSSLLNRIALIHDQHRRDMRAAIGTYERLLEIDPDETSPLDSLEALHTTLGDWRGLVGVFERKVERVYDPEERTELFIRSGSVLEELLGEPREAIDAYRRALEENPEDEVALESLDRLYTQVEDAEPLGEILERRVELAPDAASRVELGVRLGALMEGSLQNPESAVRAFQRVLDDEPRQPEAVVALSRLYRSQGMWPELLENLRLQAEMAEGTAERATFLHRAGEIYELEMDYVLDALPLYQEVLELDPGHGPSIDALLRIARLEEYRTQAAELLEPLLAAQHRYDDLAGLLEAKAQAAYDPFDKRQELRRLADIHETGREDPRAAFETYQRALAEDPSDVDSAEDVERLAAALGDWESAANAFAARASSAPDPDVSRQLYGRLARIAEERLDDDARAIEAHSRGLEQSPEDEATLAALDRLYVKTQSWRDLADILERRVQAIFDPPTRNGLLLRLGELRRDRFEDSAGALRALTEVLETDPENEAAQAALEPLLEDDDLALEVVEVLDAAYRQTNRMDRIPALLDVRVRFAIGAGEKVPLHQEQAAVFEQDLGRPDLALSALRAAFLLDPRDEGIVSDLERLADASDGWAHLDGLIEAALEAEANLDRMVLRDLNLRAAGWYRDRLGAPERAEARYRGAIAAEADTPEAHEALVALLRSPGREADLVEALVAWAEADFDEEAQKARLREAAGIAETNGDGTRATEVLRRVLDIDAVDMSALDELIRLRGAAGDHAGVVALLGRRIDAEMEPELRLPLRKQLAAVIEHELDDAPGATEAWQAALDEDPQDLDAIVALERLYEAQERWTDLEELIQRRLDFADTTSERIAARVRLARLAEQRFGRREEAIDQLREILEEDATNAEALDELERLYTAGAEWDELVALLRRRAEDAAERGDPAELDHRVRLGEVTLEHLGRRDEAVSLFREVLDRDPHHAGVLEALLELHEASEEWPEAMEMLQRLADASSEADETRTRLFGIAEMARDRLGDASAAGDALRRAQALDPTHGETRERLKAHYEGTGEAGELAELLLQDLEETPDTAAKVELLKRVADLYAGPLDDPGAAVPFLEQASGLVPEDRDVLLPLCDLYIAAGRQNDAIPVLEQIIASYGTRRNKEVAVYHHRLGKAKASMGDVDGAMASYDAAFKVDLTNIAVLTDLGRLCLERGDLDRAQKTFRALLLQKLKPDSPIQKADVYYYLGEISARQDDARKAISMLERAVAEDPGHEAAKARLAELKG